MPVEQGRGRELMADQRTVHEVTYDLLRSLGLTTVFGNPGSTEQTFLKNFPDDFTYVLGLQEASVLAMADGFAQSTGKPALVNVHTPVLEPVTRWATWWRRTRATSRSSSRPVSRPAR